MDPNTQYRNWNNGTAFCEIKLAKQYLSHESNVYYDMMYSPAKGYAATWSILLYNWDTLIERSDN